MELLKRDDGWYLGVKINENISVPCLILQGNAEGMRRCANCNFVTETLCRLECEHQMCEYCYGTITCYTCKLDRIVTRKDKTSKPCYNTDLDGVVLGCPGCEEFKLYCAMKNHILEKHAKTLIEVQWPQPENSEEKHPSQHRNYPGHENSEGCSKIVETEKPVRAAVGADLDDRAMDCEDSTPLASTGAGGGEHQNDAVSKSVFCPYCCKPWEEQEIEEHMDTCSKLTTECPECVEEIKPEDYEKHMIQCSKKCEDEKADGSLSSPGVDDGSEIRQKIEEVKELKKAIQTLEERMKKLEMPLERVIQRLREEAVKRNK